MQLKRKIIGLLFACLTIMVACVKGGAITDRMLSTPTGTEPFIVSTFAPIQNPKTSPTQINLTFYIEPEVPGGIWEDQEPPKGTIWAGYDLQNAIILDQAVRIPEGQISLAEVEWVYALVSPFKTVQDDVSFADLQATWFGNPQGSTSHLSSLLVYERDYDSLQAILGEVSMSGGVVPFIQRLTDPLVSISDQLDQNTWAIVPFDQLHPELKVITVDGISPLNDNFSEQSYSLKGYYTLYTSPATADIIPVEVLDSLLEALPGTNRDPARMTTLVMTGVTALVRATAHKMETKGILYPARDVGVWLSSADITHISNEVSFYENCPYPDPYDPLLTFCSNPEYISLLDYVGADVVELSGNHNNDATRMFDEDSFGETLAMYDAHGMLTFGGGLNLEDAMQPAFISHNGNNLAFIGCNIAGPNFAWATSTTGGAAPCGDLTWMVNTITRLRQDGYLPIVTFQYYEDYSNDASSQMKADFRSMAEAGAVIVNGSQAHRPKEMEFLNGALIHYGLGNLFFDQMSVTINEMTYTQTRNEFIQRHIFYDGRYISTQLLTAVLEDWARPRPMTPEERQNFLNEIFSIDP